MSLKDDLRPISKNRVIDLVQAAGVDVSDWGNYARGMKWAAANPKYCYEWSFIQPSHVAVLNLWHENLQERGQEIFVLINMREEAKRIQLMRAKPIWVKRALNMDDVIKQAYEGNLIVRVIINEGEMRKALTPHTKASVVKQRSLDPVKWSVKSYNPATGQAKLIRGGDVLEPVDQFDLDPAVEFPAPQKTPVSSSVFIRDSAVRAAALERANGRCEFCGQPGFLTTTGKVFLETHHIVPLSSGGLDIITNVAAVCANHHREAHFGAQAELIRNHLLEVALSTKSAVSSGRRLLKK
jgi:5-methylcytosine-specific restriction protein A